MKKALITKKLNYLNGEKTQIKNAVTTFNKLTSDLANLENKNENEIQKDIAKALFQLECLKDIFNPEKVDELYKNELKKNNKIISQKTIKINKKFKKIEGKNIDLICTNIYNASENDKYVSTYYFDIVLHGTDIVVGKTDARLGFNENLFYGGNTGYSIDPKYRGNGYAGEAVKLLKNPFKENGFNKIIITNNPDNFASIRVCEKLGARLICTLPIPEYNDQYLRGDRYKNIWEYVFE